MKLLLLLSLFSYPCFNGWGEEPVVYDQHALDICIGEIAINKRAIDPKVYDAQILALIALAHLPKYDPNTNDSIHAGINSLRTVASQKPQAEKIKHVFDAISGHEDLREKIILFTLITGDESTAENTLKLADDAYFKSQILENFIPTAASILRSSGGGVDRKALGSISLEQEDGESDIDFQKREDENSRKIEASYQESRANLYQPLLIEALKGWLVAAKLSKDRTELVKTGFDKVAGKGSWNRLIVPMSEKK